jgi:hypothetical protein
MTVEEYRPEDVLVVAVPRSDNHRSRIGWQSRPLMQKVGISLVFVGRDGVVEGMPKL